MRALLLALTLVAAASLAAPQPSNEDAHVTAARLNGQLAIAYLRQGEIGTAKEKIDKALGQNPKDASVQLAAGLVYEALHDLDTADRHFSDALRLEPKNPEMMNNYAVFLCRRGHYAQGQKLFEQAARNPIYATPEVAFANAGVCARSAKDLPRAEELFRRALSARQDYPDALLQLADLTFERGNGLGARALLERYFGAAPPSPESLYLALRVERSLGDQQAAERYAAQLQKDYPDSTQARALRGGSGG
jgi:type IV pilus assembly protein PilF